MKIANLPANKFPIPFANAAGSGYIRPIPVPSQSGITPGAASLTDGFPAATFLPVGSGGTPPFGQDFNGLLNQITQWTKWQNAGGLVPYDAAYSTSIGGYPQGAILAGTSAGSVWLSIVDDNTSNPNVGGANWINVATSIAVQNNQYTYVAAGGTSSALTATLSPVPTSLVAGMEVNLLISSINPGAATLSVNGLGAQTIVRPNGDSLIQGDLLPSRIRKFVYDGTNWQLAASPQSTVGGFSTYSSPGTFTFTVPTGITRLKVYLWGAGGGGGGSSGAGSAGSAGANGGYCEGYFLVTPGQSIAVTIGTGGAGGNAATPSNGSQGTPTSFGSLCSSTGGGGGGTGFGVIYTGPFATGGVASGASINIGGGIGGYGFPFSGTSAAGGTAQGDYGRPGGSIATGTGAPGIFPGGGGGGGANNSGGGNGGPGANGFIVVEY